MSEAAHVAIAPIPQAPVLLGIRGVSKRFGRKSGAVQALQDVSLDVMRGEFVCLVGPSGCGKSTLLNMLAGLTRPDSGEVLERGRAITGPDQGRMMMFQDAALFPWLTVMGNVLFGLELRADIPRSERRAIAEHHLKKVGLERAMNASIHELSGGMRQRVALARALAPDPQVLLMDEPFAALDAMTREQIYADIQRIWEEQRKTVVLVTHNIREAVCLGDRVILMTPGPGRIRAEYRIDLKRPRDINSVALARYTSEIMQDFKSRYRSTEEVAE